MNGRRWLESKLMIFSGMIEKGPFLWSVRATQRKNSDFKLNKMQRIQDFQPGGSGKHVGADDPRHALQENRGLTDQWCVDDGDILCRPTLVLPYPQAFDRHSQR